MEKVKRYTFSKIILASLFLIIFCFLEIALFNIRELKKKSDEFSGAVSRVDQVSAWNSLQELGYFYNLNKKLRPLGLDGIANKYLFEDAQHYLSAYDYLTGNYEKIRRELKDDNSYWGNFIRANSKWRVAQGIFSSSLDKNKEEKIRVNEQKQAIEMTASTKDEYEQAIKEDRLATLPPKWNYDLTTDPAAAARALAPKPIKIKIVLGEGGEKGNNPGERDGDAPGKGTLDLDKKKGDKPNQSTNPGSGREG